MSTPRGNFVWYELMTTDMTSAIAFYRRVIGWGAEAAGLPDREYTILKAGDTPMGGVMELPLTALVNGARPAWIGYIGVDDTDASVARVTAAGGSVHRDAEDIPGVGRFAMVADPQGAPFVLFTPHGGAAAPEAGDMPGRVGWHSLHAADREAAFAFYADLFGWTKVEAIDMGPMGIYQIFATGGPAGDAMSGGMMTKADASSPPGWLYYFNVDDAAAAAARITRSGGSILNGPIQVRDGRWFVQGVDPQGAMFAMLGPRVGGGVMPLG
jgi:hypothetical protein